jgi:hypothetical protein
MISDIEVDFNAYCSRACKSIRLEALDEGSVFITCPVNFRMFSGWHSLIGVLIQGNHTHALMCDDRYQEFTRGMRRMVVGGGHCFRQNYQLSYDDVYVWSFLKMMGQFDFEQKIAVRRQNLVTKTLYGDEEFTSEWDDAPAKDRRMVRFELRGEIEKFIGYALGRYNLMEKTEVTEIGCYWLEQYGEDLKRKKNEPRPLVRLINEPDAYMPIRLLLEEISGCRRLQSYRKDMTSLSEDAAPYKHMQAYIQTHRYINEMRQKINNRGELEISQLIAMRITPCITLLNKYHVMRPRAPAKSKKVNVKVESNDSLVRDV